MSNEKCGIPTTAAEIFAQKTVLLNSIASNTDRSVEESKELVDQALSAKSKKDISA